MIRITELSCNDLHKVAQTKRASTARTANVIFRNAKNPALC